MRVTYAEHYIEERDAISHDWINWILDRKVTPVLIPNRLVDIPGYLDKYEFALIILSNGNDIIHSQIDSDYSELRNQCEYSVLSYSIEHQIPVLGVCRGMQLINAFFNGSLCQSLHCRTKVHHSSGKHDIILHEPLSTQYGKKTLTTNSYHNHGIFQKNLAKQTKALASSRADQLVECLGHEEFPILGIQWHPERQGAPTDFDNWIVNSLIEKKNFWSKI